jgi:predicted TIM-barrel fold metal-dependent hydrolase
MLCAPAVSAQQAPVADHHQHLFSPALVAMLGAEGGDAPPVLTARDLIPLLDSAHVERAVLLSVAYMYGSPRRTVEDEYAKVRAENDWTAGQAAAYPDRLIAFCGFNQLKDYALDELAGVNRILFGSDAAVGGNLRPGEQWAALRRLPLTPDELDRIARNIAPYFQ